MPNGGDKQKYNTPIPSGAQVGEPIPQGATIGDEAPSGDVSDPTRDYTPSSTASTVGREGLLGLFSGLGIPETMTPVEDLAKGIGAAPRSFSDIPFAGPLPGIVKGLWGAGKELFAGPQDEPGLAAHGLGSLIGQGLQLGTAAKIPEAVESGATMPTLGRALRAGPGEAGAGELRPWVKAPGTLFPAAARIPAIANPDWLPEHPNVVRAGDKALVSKIPNRMPKGVTSRLGGGLATPEEGVQGAVGKPSSRLVLTPGEEAARQQMQKIATKMASEKGMQYAAGIRPEGSKVPRAATPTTEVPYQAGGWKWNPDTEAWERK